MTDCKVEKFIVNMENGKGEGKCRDCGEVVKINSFSDLNNLRNHICLENNNG